ncbi:MAG TPA: hypothetical protein VEY88_05165 [Archangium sp.]|nr:hypothetical protein [Archangium sp.]
MDDTALFQKLEEWSTTGEAQALRSVLDLLLFWLPIRQPIRLALGEWKAEEVRMEVIEELLLKQREKFARARSPRGYARTVLANRYRDELRQLALQERWTREGLYADAAAAFHSEPRPDVLTGLEREQHLRALLEVLAELRLEERVALLLLYAPERVSPADWSDVGLRHPPPPPPRPSAESNRGTIAHLLFPNEPPERARDRVTQLIRRTKLKLREALAHADETLGEEEP